MPELCNIDGRIAPLHEATVPVMDRGFLFGDSIYEVACTRWGVPFALPEHLVRLRASADGLGITMPVDDATLLRRIKATIHAAALPGEVYVRIIVTRGTGSAPNIDLGYAPGPARVVLIVRPAPTTPAQPGKLAIVERLRVDRRALDPAIKSGNYLNSVLALAEAKRAGADDCVMLNTAGFVTEASTSNVFAVRKGVLMTPPLTAGILAGVTRGLMLEMCKQQGIAAIERDLTAHELRSADEVFLTSTTKDAWPIVAIDGKPVADGQPGAHTLKLGASLADRARQLVRDRYEPAWRAVTDQGD